MESLPFFSILSALLLTSLPTPPPHTPISNGFVDLARTPPPPKYTTQDPSVLQLNTSSPPPSDNVAIAWGGSFGISRRSHLRPPFIHRHQQSLAGAPHRRYPFAIMNGIRGGGPWWKLLTDSEIRQIEKEFNPKGLSFSPPISWPEAVLAHNLAIAYSRHDRGIAPNPLPDIQLATEYLIKELNRILNKRREEQRTPQLAAWIRQGYYAYTHEEVWNPVAVVASSSNSDFVGKPATDGSGVVATGSVRTTTSEVHMAGSSSFQRPVRKEPYQKSEISTLHGGPIASANNVGTGIRPTVPTGTSPTMIENEISLSPKRVVVRGRATTTRPNRQGPEPTGSCLPKRSRVAHACPHCIKTFPFPSKLK